jgi:hypothetical protein
MNRWPWHEPFKKRRYVNSRVCVECRRLDTNFYYKRNDDDEDDCP